MNLIWFIFKLKWIKNIMFVSPINVAADVAQTK